MSFRLERLGVTLGLLIAAGFPLRALESRSTPGSPLASAHMAAAAGHGNALLMLGGMRALPASFCWLRTNLAWERRDAGATAGLIQLTVALDERPLGYWLNGARMVAYDLPEWRRDPLAPLAWQARVSEDYAQQALRLLEQGLWWHGTDPALYIEMANIHLRQRHDRELAAHYYRLAAEQPGAPYYAARIHGELLRELGRPREALAWLTQRLPELRADDPLARREIVIERIKALEREVAVSEGAGKQ